VATEIRLPLEARGGEKEKPDIHSQLLFAAENSADTFQGIIQPPNSTRA
jgi:hypothetical protein